MKLLKVALLGMLIFLLGVVGLKTETVLAQFPTDPLSQIEIAFEGNYARSQIQQRVDEAMKLYNVPKTDENYSRVGSVLVALRKETGQHEMDILDYMIKSYVPGVTMSFPDAAAISATFLQAGDR